ncbi:uncharacterized protein [Temnothorax longispinosus]|uniref:uncharacterized protein n=1 Tax=Temnothorax longispinosus TaxID=300112 RepID=UPI003A99781D
MNVTNKQKRILLNYMKDNEDFARGRLRYNSSNKKILDDMWTSITISLNATGNGPQKQAKEWQKTWRDWKSNVLKKCAQNKSYAGGTSGGLPKVLQLTELEESLLEILDPEAAGLADIPEAENFNRTKQRGSVPTNPVAANPVPTNDTIPKKESCETIAQEIEQHPPNSMQIKRKSTSTLASNNKRYKMDNIAKYPSTSTSGVLHNTDFSAR